MTATTTERDQLEARVRERMAAVARIEVRGWDGMDARVEALARCDAALDEWNERAKG